MESKTEFGLKPKCTHLTTSRMSHTSTVWLMGSSTAIRLSSECSFTLETPPPAWMNLKMSMERTVRSPSRPPFPYSTEWTKAFHLLLSCTARSFTLNSHTFWLPSPPTAMRFAVASMQSVSFFTVPMVTFCDSRCRNVMLSCTLMV